MSISLKELKKNRLTPVEKWLLDLIEGVEPKTLSGGDVRWLKDGKWLFEQDFKNGYLVISYTIILYVLKYQFGLKNDELKELLSNILYDYTDNGKLEIGHILGV